MIQAEQSYVIVEGRRLAVVLEGIAKEGEETIVVVLQDSKTGKRQKRRVNSKDVKVATITQVGSKVVVSYPGEAAH